MKEEKEEKVEKEKLNEKEDKEKLIEEEDKEKLNEEFEKNLSELESEENQILEEQSHEIKETIIESPIITDSTGIDEVNSYITEPTCSIIQSIEATEEANIQTDSSSLQTDDSEEHDINYF